MLGKRKSKRIKIDDLDIYQKSWSYGMQKIAERIIAKAYDCDNPDRFIITNADFKHLVFEGYDAMDWNKKFVLHLKITPQLKEEILHGSNQENNN